MALKKPDGIENIENTMKAMVWPFDDCNAESVRALFLRNSSNQYLEISTLHFANCGKPPQAVRHARMIAICQVRVRPIKFRQRDAA